MTTRAHPDATERPALSDRQAAVLRAVVAAYVGDAAPVGSRTVSHLLPVSLSAASVRNTMAELAELGMIEKPHRSAGRVPTRRGLHAFLERAPARALGNFERRALANSVEGRAAEGVIESVSRSLSEYTRQLGFAMGPRLDTLQLRHVSLVRMSTQAILVVLVSDSGVTMRPVVEDDGPEDQAELDRVASVLNERIPGRTLAELREDLAREAASLRAGAPSRRRRAAALGSLALVQLDGTAGLVCPLQPVLLEQPEFRDPQRVRELFAAIEDREALVRILDQVIEEGSVRVELGEEPGWRDLALVAAPYRIGRPEEAPGAAREGADARAGAAVATVGAAGAVGAIGVIGPRRMDYPKVMAVVDYLSDVVTEKLSA